MDRSAAATFVLVSAILGIVGIGIECWLLDSATCNLVTLFLFFLTARVGRGDRNATISSIVIIAVGAVWDAYGAWEMAVHPERFQMHGVALPDFSRIGMSIWLCARSIWAIIAVASISFSLWAGNSPAPPADAPRESD